MPAPCLYNFGNGILVIVFLAMEYNSNHFSLKRFQGVVCSGVGKAKSVVVLRIWVIVREVYNCSMVLLSTFVPL